MNSVKRGEKEFFRYVLPTTGAMLSFSVYTMTSGIIVARGEGEAALAALNLSMPLVNMMFAVSVLLSVGAATVIGIYKGRGNMRLANRTFTEDLLAVIGTALVFTLVTTLFPQEVARFLGGTELTLEYATEYIRTTGFFAAAYMVSYNLEVMASADGRPNMAFAGVLTCGVVTAGLGWLFVVHMGLGMFGAALSAGLGQVASILVFLTHFLSKRAKLTLSFEKPLDGLFRRVLPLGFSDFSNEVALALTAFLYNRVLLMAVGEQGVVSYAVISYVNTLVVMLLAGVSQGSQPLVSRSRGARDYKRMFSLYGYGLRSALFVGIGVLGVCFAFAPSIAPLLLENGSEALPPTVDAMRLFAFAFPLMSVNIVTSGFLAASEAPRYSTAISLGRGLLLAPVLYALAALGATKGLWLSSAVSEGICLIASVVLLRRRKAELCEPKPRMYYPAPSSAAAGVRERE